MNIENVVSCASTRFYGCVFAFVSLCFSSVFSLSSFVQHRTLHIKAASRYTRNLLPPDLIDLCSTSEEFFLVVHVENVSLVHSFWAFFMHALVECESMKQRELHQHRYAGVAVIFLRARDTRFTNKERKKRGEYVPIHQS